MPRAVEATVDSAAGDMPVLVADFLVVMWAEGLPGIRE